MPDKKIDHSVQVIVSISLIRRNLNNYWLTLQVHSERLKTCPNPGYLTALFASIYFFLLLPLYLIHFILLALWSGLKALTSQLQTKRFLRCCYPGNLS